MVAASPMVIEGNEMFQLKIGSTNHSRLSVGDTNGSATVIIMETTGQLANWRDLLFIPCTFPLLPPPALTVEFDQTAYTVTEGGRPVTVTLTAQTELATVVLVTIEPMDDNFTAMDFMFTSTDNSDSVDIMAVVDNVVDGNQTFTLSLTGDTVTGDTVTGDVTVDINGTSPDLTVVDASESLYLSLHL